MADSSPQIAVADWINREWLPHRMGETFFRAKVRLLSGGEHSFASVNADKTAVGTICTSGPRNGGKLKVRADLYFLLMAQATRRFVIFTDPAMDAYFAEERRKGQIPKDIGFVLATGIPTELMERLRVAQRSASDELTVPIPTLEIEE